MYMFVLMKLILSFSSAYHEDFQTMSLASSKVCCNSGLKPGRAVTALIPLHYAILNFLYFKPKMILKINIRVSTIIKRLFLLFCFGATT